MPTIAEPDVGKASQEEGLSSHEAGERLAKCGPNDPAPPVHRSELLEFLRLFLRLRSRISFSWKLRSAGCLPRTAAEVVPCVRRNQTADVANGQGEEPPSPVELARNEDGLFRLVASLQGDVAHAKGNADLLEEGIGRLTPGEDPDEIVGNLQ